MTQISIVYACTLIFIVLCTSSDVETPDITPTQAVGPSIEWVNEYGTILTCHASDSQDIRPFVLTGCLSYQQIYAEL